MASTDQDLRAKELSQAKARAKAALQASRSDFRKYAERFLKIRPKEREKSTEEGEAQVTTQDLANAGGGLVPLIFNYSQNYVHDIAEQQLRERGYVRILVLKGRQTGISTYIEGRAYWKGSGAIGWKGFILTHRDDATANLWAMTLRYHEHMDPRLKPHTRKESEKGMLFDRLDSRFAVATAGGRGVGRSDTLNFFHGSEVAYWPNAEDHAGGVLETVPMAGLGTEVWLETTGDGPNNYFAKQWRLAVAGKTDYAAVFIPWFWHAKYRRPVPKGGLELDQEDAEYQEMHGLDDEQMAFRAFKIASWGNDTDAQLRFEREYPATPDEALQPSDTKNSVISSLAVLRARRTTVDPATQRNAPLVYGADPSYTGGDRFVIYARRGRWARRVEKWVKKDTVQSAMRCAEIIRRDQPDAFIVEITGYGAGVYDQLRHMDLGKTHIIPYQGGNTPDEPEQYVNKRAECWGRMAEWFNEPPYPDLDDDEEIHADLTVVQKIPDSGRYRLKLETKEAMSKRDIPSPDNGDALAVTFATHVIPADRRKVPDPKRPVAW